MLVEMGHIDTVARIGDPAWTSGSSRSDFRSNATFVRVTENR